ncbi:MAG: hypothetical protein R3F15_02775 [Lysobacterales bacterium]
MVLLVTGLASSDVLTQIHWRRVRELLLCGALLWLLPSLAGWLLGRSRTVVLCALLLLAVPVLHGLGPTLAVLGLFLLALRLGSLLGLGIEQQPLISLTVGLSVLAALAGWLLPWPMPLLDLLILALLLCVGWLWEQRPALLRQGRQLLSTLQRRSAFWPLWLVGMGWLPAALPSVQFDDLAYHLALPLQLEANGFARLDAYSQVWSLAPWAGDALQGWAAVLAGHSARGAVNLLWWLLLWSGVYRLCRAAALPGTASRSVLVGAAMPMGWMLLGGQQTELPAAAVLVALVAWLIDPAKLGPRRQGLVGGVLTGMLLGLKISHLAFVGPLLAAAALSRPRRLLAWLPTAVPATLIVAGSSYSYATWISGNPVLPLYNGWFGAPQLPVENLFDRRYAEGLDLSDAFGLWFDSSRYFEGWDGVAGWQFVLLLGPLLWGWRHWRLQQPSDSSLLDGRVAMAALLLGALLLFAQMQYLRYLYPVLVIASVPLALGLGSLSQQRPRLATGLLGFVVVLNLLYVPNVSWILRDRILPAGTAGSAAGEVWAARMAPERELIDAALAIDPHASILLGDIGLPYLAHSSGRALTTSWYDPELSAAAAECANDARCWPALWQRAGISHLIHRDGLGPAALDDALTLHARPLRLSQQATLYEIDRPWAVQSPVVPNEAWTIALPGRPPWRVEVRVEGRCLPGSSLGLSDQRGLLQQRNCPSSGRALQRVQWLQEAAEPLQLRATGLQADGPATLHWRARHDLLLARESTLPAWLREARR